MQATIRPMDQRGVIVIGGGLAGSEAAWQCAIRGIPVRLHEMRPVRPTAVHRTDRLAELVCSNSFKSSDVGSAHGLLKEELRRLGSLVISCARGSRVPAGSALAVDRERFARAVTERLTAHPLIEIVREEVTTIPAAGPVIIAAGPLCSDALAREIARFTGEESLAFFDAISPIVEADSIDTTIAFHASRYGKGEGADYLNCPMTREEYEAFHDALVTAEQAEVHDFDRRLLFEGCLPVEEMARRGRDTLRFGPLKPVGLTDPRTGLRPWAVVQLRQDDLAATHYSLVGFQTRLRQTEQKRVFRMIPGLAGARFVKFGMIHRNTYINAPRVLHPTFQARRREDLFFAGQISGVEGYTESTASGLLAGLGAAALLLDQEPPVFPETTALGALQRYVSRADSAGYQPTNIAFGLFPPLTIRVRGRRERRRALAERALAELDGFVSGCKLLHERMVPAATPGAAHGAGETDAGSAGGRR